MINIQDFIGKTVINAQSRKRYVLSEITSPYIAVKDADGRSYRYLTVNGDPIKNVVLVFEDAALTEPFKAAYEAYCNTKAAYFEEVGYWMRQG